MQGKSERRTNEVRSQDMRARLMKEARCLFINKGYAETGTPEIVKNARVTRGALYHHFKDKTDLFRAVVQAEAIAVASEIKAGAEPHESPISALKCGAAAYFEAMKVKGRSRLLLLDGPAILGASEMAEIDSISGEQILEAGLAAVLEHIDAPVGELSQILSAGFDRAALAIATGAPAAPFLDAIFLVLDSLVHQKN